MLYIRCMGHGAIPRGMGIAPHKAPFKVDRKTLEVIIQQGGLKPEAINPFDRRQFVPLTMSNVNEIWNLWNNAEPGVIPLKQSGATLGPDTEAIKKAEAEAAAEKVVQDAVEADKAKEAAKQEAPKETPPAAKTEPAKEQPKEQPKTETVKSSNTQSPLKPVGKA